MSRVSIKNLSKSYDGIHKAVDNVSFEVKDGELFALLGSSGCGKTTILRCLAGLERAECGSIEIDGEDISSAAASERGIGMVFQNYALFPHMTVRDNTAYGLMAKNYAEANIFKKALTLCLSPSALLNKADKKKVEEALELAELKDFADRLPGQLSGGQQQRAALARALVTRPKILLFDEPLGALDAKLRFKMSAEIRKIQKKSGITALYVTHDQEEALSVSDRAAVMDKGCIIQEGRPEEVFLHPKNRFIADFIGIDNIFAAQLHADNIFKTEGGFNLKLPETKKLTEGKYCLAVRPEFIELSKEEKFSNSFSTVKGIITDRAFMGTYIKFIVQCGTGCISVFLPLKKDCADFICGSEVCLGIDADDIIVLEEN